MFQALRREKKSNIKTLLCTGNHEKHAFSTGKVVVL